MLNVERYVDIKFLDLDTREEETTFGTCELCLSTVDYVFTDALFEVDGEEIAVELGTWDWGDYFELDGIVNLVDFAAYISNKSHVRIEKGLNTYDLKDAIYGEIERYLEVQRDAEELLVVLEGLPTDLLEFESPEFMRYTRIEQDELLVEYRGILEKQRALVSEFTLGMLIDFLLLGSREEVLKWLDEHLLPNVEVRERECEESLLGLAFQSTLPWNDFNYSYFYWGWGDRGCTEID